MYDRDLEYVHFHIFNVIPIWVCIHVCLCCMSVCVHVCMNLCMYMHMHICVCKCGGQRLTLDVFLCCSLSYFWDAVSHWTCRLRWTGCKPTESFCLCLADSGITYTHFQGQLCMWVLGIWAQCLMLAQQLSQPFLLSKDNLWQYMQS